MTAEEEIQKIKDNLKFRAVFFEASAKEERDRELSNVYRQISGALKDELAEIEEMERWN